MTAKRKAAPMPCMQRKGERASETSSPTSPKVKKDTPESRSTISQNACAVLFFGCLRFLSLHPLHSLPAVISIEWFALGYRNYQSYSGTCLKYQNSNAQPITRPWRTIIYWKTDAALAAPQKNAGLYWNYTYTNINYTNRKWNSLIHWICGPVLMPCKATCDESLDSIARSSLIEKANRNLFFSLIETELWGRAHQSQPESTGFRTA